MSEPVTPTGITFVIIAEIKSHIDGSFQYGSYNDVDCCNTTITFYLLEKGAFTSKCRSILTDLLSFKDESISTIAMSGSNLVVTLKKRLVRTTTPVTMLTSMSSVVVPIGSYEMLIRNYYKQENYRKVVELYNLCEGRTLSEDCQAYYLDSV